MKVFLKLKWHFISEKKSYLIGIFSLVVVSLLELIPPLLIGRFVDHGINNTLDYEISYELASYLTICAVTTYFFRVLWRVFIYRPAFRLSSILRSKIFLFLTCRNSHFFQKNTTGDLMAYATNDIKAIEGVAGDGILVAFDSIISFCTVFIMMMVYIDPVLSLLAFTPFPFLGIAIYRFAFLLESRFTNAQKTFADLNSRTQESFSGIKAIKSHYLYDLTLSLFDKSARENRDAHISVAKIDMLIEPAINVCMAFSFVITLAYGAWLIFDQQLSVGQLTTFTMYLSSLIWPMFAFGWLFSLVEKGAASYERIESLLSNTKDTEAAYSDTGTFSLRKIPLKKIMVASNLYNIKDNKEYLDINIDISHFSYSPKYTFSLKKIQQNFTINNFIGIVGPTGSGKSTFIKLLVQEYSNYKGKININVKTNLPHNDWWSMVAYVSQETFLFTGSIADNILLGYASPNINEAIEAAKLACLDPDILLFPNAYETIIGERGVNLSGGQKQRLAIARAIVQKKPFLILDDPFSALDSNTESIILKNIRNLEHLKFILLSSHRLTNLTDCSRILVFDNGEIINNGPFDLLKSHKSWFSRTLELQQSYLENDHLKNS